MGFFDSLFNQAANTAKSQASHAVNSAVNSAVNNAVNSTVNAVTNAASNKSETFTFAIMPTSVAGLHTLPESTLDTPYKTTALAMAALCVFETNPDTCMSMLDTLRGPAPMSEREKAFIRERLTGKTYLPRSFFKGATADNNYTPSQPYTITVSSNPYSFTEENYAKIFVQSAGADSPRPVTLRKKPSTGQWFITDIMCLSDIRIPKEADPWA